MASGETVLVFRPGALGDTLLTVPALRGLRNAHPSAALELIGHREAAELLVTHRIVDRARAFDDLLVLGLFLDPPRIPPAWQGARLVVLWMENAEPLAAAFRAAGAGMVIVASAAGAPSVHTAQHLVTTLSEAGVEPVLGQTQMGFPTARARPESTRRVIIHPGSGGAAKNWPAASFADLAGCLADAGWQVGLVEGPADAEAVSSVQGAARHANIVVLRPSSLKDLAELLGGAALYVGNDSGVSHLAGLLGIRTLAIFGATDPRVWAPLGPRVTILGKKNRWPSVEEVRRTATD